MPRNFLFFDGEKPGMVWWWALSEDMPGGGFETADFDGGLSLAFAYRDGGEGSGERLRREALDYITDSGIFELDVRPGHYMMGHIITLETVAKARGWSQMEEFIPARLK